jgi:branched-subunit amino acid transport protein
MTTVVALVLVSAGSLVYRLVPLLGAGRVPEQVSRAAGLAGLAMLVAITVRGVLHHQDATVTAPVALAAVAVAAGLLVSYRGRSIPVVLVVGSAIYTGGALLLRLLG